MSNFSNIETLLPLSDAQVIAVQQLLAALTEWANEKFDNLLLKVHISNKDKQSLNLRVLAEYLSREITINIDVKPLDLELVGADQGLFRQLTAALREGAARAFYHGYDVISAYEFEGERIVLKSVHKGCRFCKQDTPAVSFKKEAHALPESTGNNRVFTRYECDSCNQVFGDGIEDHFGRWTNVERSLFEVKAKNGIPKFKMQEGYIIKDALENRIVLRPADYNKVVSNEKSIEFTYQRPTHVPVAVLKAFYKMALSVMSDDELIYFQHVIDWLKKSTSMVAGEAHYPVHFAYLPHQDFTAGRFVLLRRTSNDMWKPYMVFVLSFGHCCYQVILPTVSERQNGACITHPFFPVFGGRAANEAWIKLDSTESKKGEPISFTLAPVDGMPQLLPPQ